MQVFHKGLHQKIDSIASTLKSHAGGAALAAPQVSLLKRIVVIDYMGEYYEFINPEITFKSGEETDYEGCLSLPGYFGKVKRYGYVQVKYQDRNGHYHDTEASGQMARCFQHEIDHLDGILYIDRMEDDCVYNEDTNESVSVQQLIELADGRYPMG